MSKKYTNQSGGKTNRRVMLKSIGTAGLTFGLGSQAIGTASAVRCHLPDVTDTASQENYEWRRSKSGHYEDTDSSTYDRLTQIQSGLVYHASNYISSENRWYHHFRSAGAVFTFQKRSWQGKAGYSPIGLMDYHTIKIVNDDTSSAALYTTNNPKDVGAAPSPNSGDNLNWGPAVWTVALAALGTSTYVGVAITAAQFLGALLDNGESGSGNTVTYRWDYDWNQGPCEAIHFARFDFQSFSGESSAQFHVRNIGTFDGHGGIANRYNVYVNPIPGPLSSSNVSSSMNASEPLIEEQSKPGTPEYIDTLERSNAVRKIPAAQIKDSRLKKLADGKPIYQATNPQSEVKVSSDPIE